MDSDGKNPKTKKMLKMACQGDYRDEIIFITSAAWSWLPYVSCLFCPLICSVWAKKPLNGNYKTNYVSFKVMYIVKKQQSALMQTI